MSNVPADLRFLKSHEWARLEADGTITVGISDHAQQALGDLVFVEAPEAGRRVAAGEACAVVESVKAASDVYSPVEGQLQQLIRHRWTRRTDRGAEDRLAMHERGALVPASELRRSHHLEMHTRGG